MNKKIFDFSDLSLELRKKLENKLKNEFDKKPLKNLNK
tara:strand:+ start:131 stop:244 length:114 start_codon:yes stop_codon:yes gene_type:complete